MINKIVEFVKSLFVKKKKKNVWEDITGMLQTFERRNKIAKLYGKKSPTYPIPYRKTFYIPIGELDKNKAQKEISKLISSYKEDIFKK
jgi:hypothetical protein